MRRALVLLAFVLSGCLALAGHEGLWACSNDTDCNGGDVCRRLSASSVCAPADYCETTSDCGTGGFGTQPRSCVANHCGLPPCARDADCAPYACGPSGACASSCTRTSDCEKGYECTSGLCTIVYCASDAECAGSRCELGRCLGSCSSDADCTSGASCQNASCTPRSCTRGGGATGQCGGFVCGSGGACGTSCSSNAGCDPGLVCSSGTCDCSSSPGLCGGYRCTNRACLTTCKADTDCNPGLFCSPQGKCTACAGTAAPCAGQASCDAINGCSTGTLTCTGGSFDCSIYAGDVVQCSNNLACVWDNSFSTCTGTAPCSGAPVGACSSIPGCTAAAACWGTPTPCAVLPYAQCLSTPGCSLK